MIQWEHNLFMFFSSHGNEATDHDDNECVNFVCFIVAMVTICAYIMVWSDVFLF
jgi:hypothetical protein